MVRTLSRRGGASRRRRTANAAATAMVVLAALAVLTPLVLVLVYLVGQGIGAIDLAFFTQLPAPAGEAGGGVAQAVVGTLELLALAAVIGLVIGIGTGVFVAEYPDHPLVPTVRLLSDALIGIPAIVMGLVAYALLVVPLRHFNGLSGGVSLGLIMIPYVVRATDEVMRLVPGVVREAGFALGLPRWRVILQIVLPSAASGIVTGAMLAMARVAGEAAPLLFTAFGNQYWNFDPLKPVAALPLVIYTYSISPYDSWHRIASAASLVLVAFVFATTLLTRFVFARRAR
ncbi:MAG TPA: phosphate ABC transporter permease PstA [Trueperaceae bacterium]|nr:phosphate ABC transporter permease PstA [Trueperaceae bacterium]